MRRAVPALFLLLIGVTSLQARGLLIPEDKSLPPLALQSHKVQIAIDDQVAVTRVEQVFKNHTPRELEATYIFPVPKGASVNQFKMSVNGADVKGELLEANKAREIYTSIVRRTQDPGLLEYLDGNLFKMRVYPVPANGEQKVSVSFSSVAAQEGKLIEYVYPIKSDGKATETLKDFSITATITSQHGIENVYSPTHPVTLRRKSDKEVEVVFNRNQGALDRDFHLLYQLGARDVGLTSITYRPVGSEDGYFLMLISPQLKLAKEQRVPRDLVLVMDTSGSMAGKKIEQARKALHYCLDRMEKGDRFGIVGFATGVNKYRDQLTEVNDDQIKLAKKWVDELDANGGTNINDALAAALEMRQASEERSFTIAFFTDGQPTVGETKAEKILENTLARNTANTRFFTFGVGDDVNATLLDQLADKTRAWANYVRPSEDIEAKVSNLHTKIAHPVLTNLKIATSNEVRLKEIYPPQLPDLFSGSQLIVLGRFSGKGPSAVTLSGMLGKAGKEYVYELTFPDKTGDERQMVEQLWGRRKVGYLLNEIRSKGQDKELVDEVTKLARKYGIVTPYTSYLVVPDGSVPTPQKGKPGGMPDVRFAPGVGGQFGGQFGQQFGNFGQAGFGGVGGGQAGQFGQGGGQFGGGIPYSRGGVGGGGGGPGRAPGGVGGGAPGGHAYRPGFGQGGQFGGFNQGGQFGVGGGGNAPAQPLLTGPVKDPEKLPTATTKVIEIARTLRQAGFDGENFVPLPEGKEAQTEAVKRLQLYAQADAAIKQGQDNALRTGQLGVDLSVEIDKLRRDARLAVSGQKKIAGKNFQFVAGVWLDQEYKEKTSAVVVKAQSDAYFRILELNKDAKEVFRLGNAVVWVTPNGSALVIDPKEGASKLEDAEIEKMFSKKK